MKRPSRPSTPWPAVLALAVLCAIAPAAGAQVVDQRFDPANVNNRIDDPVFQRQMRQTAQSIAENLVGRPANATDQRILNQFDQVQTQALRQIQGAMDRMPNPDAGYGGAGQMDARDIAQLSQSAEGRYVLEQMAAAQRGNAATARYPQQQQPAAQGQSEYERMFRQAYPDGMQGPPPSQYGGQYGNQGGYAPPQSSTGRALGGALIQDITNAAIQRSIGPRVQVQGNPYYPPRKP